MGKAKAKERASSLGDEISMNPLLKAVLANDLSGARRLLRQSADVHVKDRDGRTALFHAVIDGRLQLARELIKAGADVNAQDRSGSAPLHFAAQEHRIAIAKGLLDNGARVDIQDCHGNTPLGTAVFESRGRGQMITLLLRHGADKQLKNHHGVSPKDLADNIANYDVRRFLEGAR